MIEKHISSRLPRPNAMVVDCGIVLAAQMMLDARMGQGA
jgi:hypothetical protein